MYDKATRKKALSLLKSGVPQSEVGELCGISRGTLRLWLKKEQEGEGALEETLAGLKSQLRELSRASPSEAVARKVAMLTKAIATLERLEVKQIQKNKPKPKIALEVGALRKKALEEMGLLEYQREFLEDDSQFRIVLKARQIGFSYVAALDALLGASEGRNQLFLSASEEQALILMRYLELWAERLGLGFVGDSSHEKRLENGVIIKALAHNFRTAQGFSGDIWMDEFAWYPNPKKMWHAFVPSIGAIRGRLTILSTPFEESGLFHELFFDEARYFVFSRHRVDIYRAIKAGLEFDLESMRSLFDADTWASAYECQFIDDESALFSIALIKSCVHAESGYSLPPISAPLMAGYDVGRTKHRSALAILEPREGGKVALVGLEVLAQASFEEQRLHLRSFLGRHPFGRLKIDKTGIGLNLAEDMVSEFKSRVSGASFTEVLKENIALNLKKMFEDKLITIPNDPLLIADIHAIKRKAGSRRFLYDSDQNAHGHADRFWALALAASFQPVLQGKKSGRAYLL